MMAANHGCTDVVRLMVEHGADVNYFDYVSAACVGPAHG